MKENYVKIVNKWIRVMGYLLDSACLTSWAWQMKNKRAWMVMSCSFFLLYPGSFGMTLFLGGSFFPTLEWGLATVTFTLLVDCTRLQERGEKELFVVLNILNTSSSSPSHQVNLPSLTSINASHVLRKGRPKNNWYVSILFYIQIINSTRKWNLPTLTSKSSTIHHG